MAKFTRYKLIKMQIAWQMSENIKKTRSSFFETILNLEFDQ